ncbi:MAG: hypothetical protein Kow0026_25970 [Oricola sp.]
MPLKRLAPLAASALILAACTTSPPVAAGKADIARAARGIFGTSLIGVRGATPVDQDGIDAAVTGACAAGSYTPEECRRHQVLTGNN